MAPEEEAPGLSQSTQGVLAGLACFPHPVLPPRPESGLWQTDTRGPCPARELPSTSFSTLPEIPVSSALLPCRTVLSLGAVAPAGGSCPGRALPVAWLRGALACPHLAVGTHTHGGLARCPRATDCVVGTQRATVVPNGSAGSLSPAGSPSKPSCPGRGGLHAGVQPPVAGSSHARRHCILGQACTGHCAEGSARWDIGPPSGGGRSGVGVLLRDGATRKAPAPGMQSPRERDTWGWRFNQLRSQRASTVTMPVTI